MSPALRLLAALASGALLLPWQDATEATTTDALTDSAAADILEKQDLAWLREYRMALSGSIPQVEVDGEIQPPILITILRSEDGLYHTIPERAFVPNSNISGRGAWTWPLDEPCGASEVELQQVLARLTEVLTQLMQNTGRPAEQVTSARELLAEFDAQPQRTTLQSVAHRIQAIQAGLTAVKPCD